MNRLPLMAALLVLVLTACDSGEAPSTESASQLPSLSGTAFRNVHVVDVHSGSVLRDRTVVVSDGRVHAIVAAGDQLNPGLTVIDGGRAFSRPRAGRHARPPDDRG